MAGSWSSETERDGSLLVDVGELRRSKTQADLVCNVAWVKGNQALLYVVTDQNKKPYRLYCSMLGSKDEDVILLEGMVENVHVNIRHTKDFRFITVNVFSTTYAKSVCIDNKDLIVEDANFYDSYLVLTVREGGRFKLCSIALPLPNNKTKLAEERESLAMATKKLGRDLS
ncbi:hypothetical protein L6452_20062 [Arctium lappa]|uniref:Uncharacterized protein n=1 Tax=Arctium lappa TaxID=4217 RepID=A0ACB9BB57_ARCLA|nr:hypothetical protein L6452_20062 [Arctium lappa]